MPSRSGSWIELRTKPAIGKVHVRYSNEELVISEIGQVGTQFDGFTQQAIDQAGHGEGRHADDARRID